MDTPKPQPPSFASKVKMVVTENHVATGTNPATVKAGDTNRAGPSTTMPKPSRKKKETRTVRQARREAAVLQKLYAPKYSRVTLITPALMKRFNDTPSTSASKSTVPLITNPAPVPAKDSIVGPGPGPLPDSSSCGMQLPVSGTGASSTVSQELDRKTLPCRSKNMQPSKNPIVINLEQLILTNTPTTTQKRRKRIQKDVRKQFMLKETANGNILDSSRPILIHRGKLRDRPLPKRLSKLKKTVLTSRLIRQQERLQEAELESSQTSLSVSVIESEQQEIPPVPSNPVESSTIDQVPYRCSLCSDESKTADPVQTISFHESSNDIELGQIQEYGTTSKIKVEPSQNEDLKPETGGNESGTECKGTDDSVIFRKLLDEATLTVSERQSSHPGHLDPKNEITIEVINKAKDMLHNKGKKWRSYCDMYVSKDLHAHVIALLQELHRFQDRLYNTDPIKFQSNRRYVHGLREVTSALQRNKVQILIIAPDMELSKVTGGLDDKVDEVLQKAKAQGVPYLFSGHRYILGKPIRINQPVSIIGILNKQGTEELVEKLMTKVSQLRDLYTQDFNVSVTQVMEELDALKL